MFKPVYLRLSLHLHLFRSRLVQLIYLCDDIEEEHDRPDTYCKGFFDTFTDARTIRL